MNVSHSDVKNGKLGVAPKPESWGWKNVGSGRFFQCIQTDPANWWAFNGHSNGPGGPLFSSFTGLAPQFSLMVALA